MTTRLIQEIVHMENISGRHMDYELAEIGVILDQTQLHTINIELGRYLMNRAAADPYIRANTYQAMMNREVGIDIEVAALMERFNGRSSEEQLEDLRGPIDQYAEDDDLFGQMWEAIDLNNNYRDDGLIPVIVNVLTINQQELIRQHVQRSGYMSDAEE